MPMVLGQNQYGKAETRVVRVRRDSERHEVKDLNVSVALSGDLSDTHFTGGNENVLPTDTMKNTVFAFAQEHGIDSAEAYGVRLARHFVQSQPSITRARIRIEEYPWNRITAAESRNRFIGADEIQHSFVRDGGEIRTSEIVWENDRVRVISGLKDLVVMNTTSSEFWGYIKDRYTTLQEAYDRILATQVTARWRFSFDAGDDAAEPNWERSYAQVRRHLLEAFSETYSYSLQQTLFAMANRVLTHRHEVDEVRLSLPNKHNFLVDMDAMDIKNDKEVYYAADRPYGLIEGTVHREGVTPLIPVD
ncbi:factor-independent urate hydroxylase [Streptomyces sp. SID3343]|uniref:factor-independent urate hydroxylase n=1 Tax=Streptomyces sp. SID3343 TaxID=2690260 RepID=UPI001368911D|nr:urate oxidase [Streptomyces sp. SID3343]